MEVSVTAMCIHELGKRKFCDEVKYKIAKYYGVKVEELFQSSDT